MKTKISKIKLFKKKPKFIYELSECDLLRENELFNPDDLVQFIEEEDYRFRRDYLKGSVIISKLKNDLQGTVYYAKRIQLPQEEDFDWLEELSDFYTKKPIDHFVEEPVIDTESSSEPSSYTSSDQPITLDDFESDLQTETEVESQTQVQVEKDEDLIIPPEIQESVTEDAIGEEFVQVSKSELLSIRQAMDHYKKEMEQFRSEKEAMAAAEAATISAHPSIETNSTKEATKYLNKESLVEDDPVALEVTADEIVQEVLQSTKVEFGQALTKFIESETEKINQEIQQLDQRHRIDEEVTKRLEAKKQAELSTLKSQLISQKQQQVQEEKLRHKQALQHIEQSLGQKLEEETTAIQNSYKETIDQTIKKEYDDQTEQLSRILQGKMDELKLRQHKVNTGLEANFKEVLETFNRKHTQVIHEVEQKKQQSPISLKERRLRKQA